MPAEWYSHPDLQPLLAARDVGALFGWLRHRGWSQNRIAAATGMSQPEVSSITKGRQVQAVAVLERVADGLGIPRGYLGLAFCTGCSATAQQLIENAEPEEGDDPVERREFISAVATVAAGGVALGGAKWLPGRGYSVTAIPAKVGAPEVARVRAMTDEFRRLGEQHGGGAVLDAAEGYAGHAERLLASQLSATSAKQLRLAIAELHALIGWSHHDGGRPAAVRRHYYRALTLARDATEPEFVGDALADLAHAATDNGDAESGVKLARIGLATATGGISAATLANLHIEAARALAALGDERAARGALDEAAYELDRADVAAIPPYATIGRALATNPAVGAGRRLEVYEFLSRTPQHRAYAGRAVILGEHIARMGDSRRRVALTRTSFAAAQLRAGDPRGLDTAHEVIDESGTFQSARTLRRLADLARATGNSRARPMADLRAKIADLNQPSSPRPHPADAIPRTLPRQGRPPNPR
jgi:transcriptional regulator with XRE-family HTH domain